MMIFPLCLYCNPYEYEVLFREICKIIPCDFKTAKLPQIIRYKALSTEKPLAKTSTTFLKEDRKNVLIGFY